MMVLFWILGALVQVYGLCVTVPLALSWQSVQVVHDRGERQARFDAGLDLRHKESPFATLLARSAFATCAFGFAAGLMLAIWRAFDTAVAIGWVSL